MLRDPGILRELPLELQYLSGPAMRYGWCASEMFNLVRARFMTRRTRKALEELARRVRENNHYPAVNEWLTSHSMVEHEQAARLYFLFGLMDTAGIKFE